MAGHGAARRPSEVGEATNELESVLTAVVSAADGLGDGLPNDPWSIQRDLGVLEDALERALGIVRRLGVLVRTEGPVRPVGGPVRARHLREAGFDPADLDARWDT